MGRKILPMEIVEQVSSIISVLEDNKDILISIIPDINAFCNSDDLQGDTWSKAKTHMENHILVIQALIVLLEGFKRLCNKLVHECGSEELDEDVLLEQKDVLKKELNHYTMKLNILETMCPIDMKDIRYAVSELYYESTLAKKSYYYTMITNLEMQIYYIDCKINEIDGIECATSNITDGIDMLQAVVEDGIRYLTASLCEDGFIFPFGYSDDWKDRADKLWNNLDIINNYVQEELFNDQKKIDVSKTNDKLYFTFDRSGIIYDGDIYEIHVPSQEEGLYFDKRYITVKEKEKNNLKFNFSKAIFGIDFEEPDFQSVNTSVQTVYTPQMTNSMAVGIILDGLIGGVGAGLEKIDMKVILQESTDGEDRRALVLMGSYENRVVEDKLNYNSTMSMYNAYIGNNIAQDAVSMTAFNMYNSMNGGNMSQGDYIYDYVANFSEDRKDNFYHAYVSFDVNGNMVVTPFRYGEEKVSIVKYDNSFCINGEEVMDVTDIVYSSYVCYSEDCSNILDMIVSDGIE